jgi:hypothetical protein
MYNFRPFVNGCNIEAKSLDDAKKQFFSLGYCKISVATKKFGIIPVYEEV